MSARQEHVISRRQSICATHSNGRTVAGKLCQLVSSTDNFIVPFRFIIGTIHWPSPDRSAAHWARRAFPPNPSPIAGLLIKSSFPCTSAGNASPEETPFAAMRPSLWPLEQPEKGRAVQRVHAQCALLVGSVSLRKLTVPHRVLSSAGPFVSSFSDTYLAELFCPKERAVCRVGARLGHGHHRSPLQKIALPPLTKPTATKP